MMVVYICIIALSYLAQAGGRSWLQRSNTTQYHAITIRDLTGDAISVNIQENITTARVVLIEVSEHVRIAPFNLSLVTDKPLQDGDIINHKKQIFLIKTTRYPQSAEIFAEHWGRVSWNLSLEGKLSIQTDGWKGPDDIIEMPSRNELQMTVMRTRTVFILEGDSVSKRL